MSDQMTLGSVHVNAELADRIIQGTQTGLMMAGIEPKAVGASRLLKASRNISVLVGLLGDHTGTMTLNVSNRAAEMLSAALLGEEEHDFNEDSLDGIGEIGNMIAGGIKDGLANTEMAFSNIACPAVVMGSNYDLYYSTSFTTVCVEFEIAEIPVTHIQDRIFTVSVSLMKR